MENRDALALIEFWIAAGPKKWFVRDAKFDDECKDYAALWARARDGELTNWGNTAAGSLALILLLDQIPRNIFRGQPEQFATDALAVAAAEAAMKAGHDRVFMVPLRGFFYLPFEHAEDMELQHRCVDITRVLGDRELYHYALIHADVIARFGRFPHRNAVLGRQTTPQEQAYLDTGGFGA